MRKNITILTFAILLFSCNNKGKEADFLDFKIGMTKSEFEVAVDTLKKQELIYNIRNGGYNGYEYFLNIDGNEISTSIFPKFDQEGLIKLRIAISEFPLPKNIDRYSYFYSKSLLSEVDSDKVFNLYLKKYGKPNKIEMWELEPTQKWGTYTWNKGIIDIIFDYGVKDDNGYIEGTSITYKFIDTFLKQREKIRKNKFNKQSIEVI